jgi:hypothetical protein
VPWDCRANLPRGCRDACRRLGRTWRCLFNSPPWSGSRLLLYGYIGCVRANLGRGDCFIFRLVAVFTLPSCLLGDRAGLAKVHVLGGLYGGGGCTFRKPLAYRGFQTRRQRRHVVFQIDALGAALVQHHLACNAEFSS